jgi:hypothetical protein
LLADARDIEHNGGLMPTLRMALLVPALGLFLTASCQAGSPTPDPDRDNPSIGAEPARPAPVVGAKPPLERAAPVQAAAAEEQAQPKGGNCCGAEMCKQLGGNCGCSGNAKGCGG